MTEQLKYAGQKHKSMIEGMNVFDAARLRMDYLYETFDTIVISWSGGKDSSTCLELARESARKYGKLPVHVLFVDEEVIYPETIELAERHHADPEIDLRWCCIPAKYRNACSDVEPDFIPWDDTKKDLWVRQPPPYALWPFGHTDSGMTNPPHPAEAAMRALWPKDEYPTLISVVGLRARESFVRYSGILVSNSFLSKPNNLGVMKARPVYDWSDKDVWLGIKTFGWDYNGAYDKLWRLGSNPQTARIAPLFHAEAALLLRRVMLGWPRFWPLVRKRVRGAHAVAIYGGQLHEVYLKEGENWKTATYRYLNALSEDDKRIQNRFLEANLSRHMKHSPYEWAETDACTECGLSWKKVCRAVALADRHGRMFKQHPKIAQTNYVQREREKKAKQRQQEDNLSG